MKTLIGYLAKVSMPVLSVCFLLIGGLSGACSALHLGQSFGLFLTERNTGFWHPGIDGCGFALLAFVAIFVAFRLWRHSLVACRVLSWLTVVSNIGQAYLLLMFGGLESIAGAGPQARSNSHFALMSALLAVSVVGAAVIAFLSVESDQGPA